MRAIDAAGDRSPAFTWGQATHLFDRWAETCLSTPAAWRLDGRPVCAFNNLTDFVARYGLTTFAVLLRYGARVVERRAGVRPYLLGLIGEANQRNAYLASRLPLDGVTGYGLLPTWLGDPIQDYRELIERRVDEWEQLQRRLEVPFLPVVCAGWDASIRGSFRGVLRAGDGYPYSPVVVNVTPELFGWYLDLALEFNARWQPRPNIVFLHAWNEWTEASVLEPSDRLGSAMLDEVRRRAERHGVALCDAEMLENAGIADL